MEHGSPLGMTMITHFKGAKDQRRWSSVVFACEQIVVRWGRPVYMNISAGWEFRVQALGVGSLHVQDAGEKPAKMARLSKS